MLKKILVKVGVLSVLIGVIIISLPVQSVQAYPDAYISISPYSPYVGERVTFSIPTHSIRRPGSHSP